MEKSNRLDILKSNFSLTTKNQNFEKTLGFCQKVANSNANVLLAGESGTGKEILAKYIHLCGNRCNETFVAVNCTSYSESLLESELFGHEQGSFTGATSSKKGKFETADKGTLFLDEVGDISAHTQVKLLRVLETKNVERIGSNVDRAIDFRLISATNVNLQHAIVKETFREDFFYRVSTIVIHVPPLRERPEDLPDLIDFFIKKSEAENNMKIHKIEAKARQFLQSYDYPGNIRELRNIIDRMVVFSENGVITEDGIPIMHSFYRVNPASTGSNLEAPATDVNTDMAAATNSYQSTQYELLPFREFKRKSERDYLEWVLGSVDWNVAEAARRLQISSRQLFNKINDLELKR